MLKASKPVLREVSAQFLEEAWARVVGEASAQVLEASVQALESSARIPEASEQL
jgi:hypothetical protein